jgi:hypothetical protein
VKIPLVLIHRQECSELHLEDLDVSEAGLGIDADVDLLLHLLAACDVVDPVVVIDDVWDLDHAAVVHSFEGAV